MNELTLTLSLEAARSDTPLQLLSRLSPASRADAIAACGALVDLVLPGADFSREIMLTADLELGETLLWYDRDLLVGFALAHTVPLVEGRTREELRVLKLVIDDERRFGAFARGIAGYAREHSVRRVSVRMQGEYTDAYRQAIALGMHVRWTDLRMALDGYRDLSLKSGMALSNWEI